MGGVRIESRPLRRSCDTAKCRNQEKFVTWQIYSNRHPLLMLYFYTSSSPSWSDERLYHQENLHWTNRHIHEAAALPTPNDISPFPPMLRLPPTYKPGSNWFIDREIGSERPTRSEVYQRRACLWANLNSTDNDDIVIKAPQEVMGVYNF